jgi:DNA-binding transcriptional ArsR family regulator
MMYFKDLDPVLHSQLRLAVISILVSEQEAEFTLLKQRTNATAGNLSVQINKLREAGYIEVIKQFRDNYPQTLCRITAGGRRAFDGYVNAMQSYLNAGKTG